MWAFHVKMFAFACFTVNANSSLSSCSTSTVSCDIRMLITRELAMQHVDLINVERETGRLSHVVLYFDMYLTPSEFVRSHFPMSVLAET